MKSERRMYMISLRLRLIREHNRICRSVSKWLWRIQGKDAARVYMFHSVVDTPEQVYSEFAITKESFEQFIHYELERGQKPMDDAMLKNAVDNPDSYKNHFAVTFDDIYDSVFENAYPILKELNVPFIIFVTPKLIDTIDSWHKHPMISMEHLKEMAVDPLCIIGAHGIEHKPFREYNPEEAIASMKGSMEWLEDKFGKQVDFFAFPYGRRIEVSEANISALSTCDYSCGFSALDGSLKQKWFSGRWYLPRILVSEKFVSVWCNV